MAGGAWYSQLFENTFNGGVLLALPYDALGDWDGTGEDYEEVIGESDEFLFRPLGRTVGLFVGDLDGSGIHEAHWMRLDDRPGLILVVWSEWDDPSRPTLPEDMKKVGRAWYRRQDPRQEWLEHRLRQDDLVWERHDQVQPIPSGVLLLLHAEGRALKARLAKPHAVAKCGEAVPVGLAPGHYRVESTIISELPDGAHLCSICRWLPAARSNDG